MVRRRLKLMRVLHCSLLDTDCTPAWKGSEESFTVLVTQRLQDACIHSTDHDGNESLDPTITAVRSALECTDKLLGECRLAFPNGEDELLVHARIIVDLVFPRIASELGRLAWTRKQVHTLHLQPFMMLLNNLRENDRAVVDLYAKHGLDCIVAHGASHLSPSDKEEEVLPLLSLIVDIDELDTRFAEVLARDMIHRSKEVVRRSVIETTNRGYAESVIRELHTGASVSSVPEQLVSLLLGTYLHASTAWLQTGPRLLGMCQAIACALCMYERSVLETLRILRAGWSDVVQKQDATDDGDVEPNAAAQEATSSWDEEHSRPYLCALINDAGRFCDSDLRVSNDRECLIDQLFRVVFALPMEKVRFCGVVVVVGLRLSACVGRVGTSFCGAGDSRSDRRAASGYAC